MPVGVAVQDEAGRLLVVNDAGAQLLGERVGLVAHLLAEQGGAPLEPVGDPLLAGVGPGAWAMRADRPDVDPHGAPKIVPLRVA